ncbi:MAG: DUF3106 domain-containing protein [Acidobacteriota bacterium]|nr:DUF3106 domain-containing protein [Acidobacteriota bacterium]
MLALTALGALAGQPPAQASERAATAAAPKAEDHPGEKILLKLNSMTSEEREQALSILPPAQRARIEQRIQNFQKLPAAQQERNLHRLERLNSLPPERQKEVRRSMNQLNNLPPDRKMALNRELRNMTGMAADERAAYMNTEAFRNRYSPDEQQMAANLAEILPARE